MPDEFLRCPACGATNRVPEEQVRAGRQPICGKCKAPLALKHEPMIVTDATYTTVVEQSPEPVVLDLWAAWCGPCKMLAPVIDELAAEWSGRVRFAKLNVDENPLTAGRLNVRSIPTLVVLKGGKEIDRMVGVQPKQKISRHLERVA